MSVYHTALGNFLEFYHDIASYHPRTKKTPSVGKIFNGY